MAVDKDMNVLVVDDYATMRKVIKMLLNDLNFYNVDMAPDGKQALQMLQSKDYGFVISDWDMQPMTGIELLKEVRDSEKLKSLPFILITGESDPEKVFAAKEAGASSYIEKPFNARTLKGIIAGVLGPI